MIKIVKKAAKYLLWKSKFLINLNHIVWSLKQSEKNFTVELLEKDQCFKHLPLSFDDEILNKHHRQQNKKWNTQQNMIIHLRGNIYIEPKRGLVLYGFNNIAGF